MSESTTPSTPTTPSNTPANDGTESPATTTSTTSNSNVKTVFLIRHAQSLENQRIASAFSCLGDIGRLSWPKRSDVGASLELLNISANHDAPLSEAGVKQCETMQKKLKECNFVSSHKIELVAHSPLTRAKQTCAELIGCSTDDIEDEEENKEGEAKDDKQQPGKNEVEEVKFEPATPDTAKTAEDPATPATTEETAASAAPSLPEPMQRVVSLNKLLEKTHMEWVPGNSGSFERRVLSFQNWLGEQPESVVCVVGHSQFFKLMLGMPFKFDNVDVYQVQFDKTKTTPNESFIMEHNGTADEVTLKPEWYELKLLHTCKETPVQEPTSPSAMQQQQQQQQQELQDVSANSDTML